MTALLDTSVVIRYITGDPSDLAQTAARLIESGDPLAITDVAISEANYVLTRLYLVRRESAIDALSALIERENIDTLHLDKILVLRALRLCRPSGRVSVPDALIWAAARTTSDRAVYSFDARFPREGIEVRSPA